MCGHQESGGGPQAGGLLEVLRVLSLWSFTTPSYLRRHKQTAWSGNENGAEFSADLRSLGGLVISRHSFPQQPKASLRNQEGGPLEKEVIREPCLTSHTNPSSAWVEMDLKDNSSNRTSLEFCDEKTLLKTKHPKV